MRAGCTFFAIDDGAGGSEMLAFLERLREAYMNAPSSKEGRVVGEEINWVVQATSGGDRNSRNRSPNDAAAHRPKVTALQPSTSGVISSSRSTNVSSKLVEQQRNKWGIRQVKIAAAIDALLCLSKLGLRRRPMCF